MSEKDAIDNVNTLGNGSNSETSQAVLKEEETASEFLDSLLGDSIKEKENEFADLDSYLPPCESQLKKEENPFSFKKFLNQDSSSQKNKGAKKKIFTPSKTSCSDNSDLLNTRHNRKIGDLDSRISASDMSSVLPDFVQDHLVIEQCYLSGSSSDIDINNLNFQNLPDLNLERRNVHFKLSDDKNLNHSKDGLSDKLSPNLPDFALGGSNFKTVTQDACNIKGLPDFALHVRTNSDEDINLRISRRNAEINNANDTSQTSRQKIQISSSPSVPLDLPPYENESNHNLPIPFDLTAPTEEKSGNCRGGASTETVSKSLPDFLSDGPIKKEMDSNIQNVREIMQNGFPSDVLSTRAEDKLHRDAWNYNTTHYIDLLKCQLMEKNQRVERLERELEHLHNKDQRETASLEYALQEVENNLRQTAKRAINAENLILKLKQENKTLKSEVSSLKSENTMLRLGNYDSSNSLSQDARNQKIAKELRTAASQAENSLRSLLNGVNNLRALADNMEYAHKFQDPNKDLQDSASGPAL